ncbi:hypothetical protein C8R47DRAFT_1225300 [Mycena vitilis]|nr:hypothetical protein C8R47DRAFT_1225300 [Mycena vitilis]
MQRAPVSWGPILVVENIPNTLTLFAKATEHQDALIQAARSARGELSLDSLSSALRKLGVRVDKDRRVNLGTIEDVDEDSAGQKQVQVSVLNVEQDDEPSPVSEAQDASAPISNDEAIVREVYQVLKKQQRDPPKGGYPFPKNDHVTTKMGKLPPSPCKTCGSKNHWDRECPDWAVYEKGIKRSANHASISYEQEETHQMYRSAYNVLLNQRLANETVDFSKLSLSGFEVAVPRPSEELETSSLEETRKTEKSATPIQAPTSRKVEIEEVEDEEDLAARAKPKAYQFLFEDNTGNGSFDMDEIARESRFGGKSEDDFTRTSKTQEARDEYYWANDGRMKMEWDTDSVFDGNESEQDEEDIKEAREVEKEPSPVMLPPPKELIPVRIPKKRLRAEGQSTSLGISVLSMRGWIGGLWNPLMDIRLDSCADLTFISEALYLSLLGMPEMRIGPKMKLCELTSGNSHISGYIMLPILALMDDGNS